MLQNEGKLWSLREWLSGFWFLFINPGIIRRSFVPWLRYFRKDFHPWQNDNRYLVEEWEKRQSAS